MPSLLNAGELWLLIGVLATVTVGVSYLIWAQRQFLEDVRLTLGQSLLAASAAEQTATTSLDSVLQETRGLAEAAVTLQREVLIQCQEALRRQIEESERDDDRANALTTRLEAVAAMVEANLPLLALHHATLMKAAADLEDQWRRIDLRARHLAQIADSVRLRARGAPEADSTVIPVPAAPWRPDLCEQECVEVISPAGECHLVPVPVRPEEPVHPDIEHALMTPGWKIRYPDGRTEEGVQ